MRAWNPPWGRPLLAVRRADTAATCAALGLRPWDDPHNADRAFTRVRLRTEVLPLLEDVLGGGVAAALARTAELMSDDLAALDEIAAAVFAQVKSGIGIDATALGRHQPAVRRRVLRSWAAAAGAGPLAADHLSRLDRLVSSGHDGASVRMPGAIDAVRTAGRVLPIPVAPPAPRHDRSGRLGASPADL
jgi:tRNA(Ile)-lysidine synthase